MSLAAQTLKPGLLRLPVNARVLVQALLLTGGELGTAARVAGTLRLRSRFQLARLLRKQVLPPLHELAAWARVLGWVEVWERSRAPLCTQAIHAQKDPAACYRLVRKLTGLRWTDVRHRGSKWIAEQLLRRLEGSKARRPKPTRRSSGT